MKLLFSRICFSQVKTFSELRTITQKESNDSHANVVVGIDMEMTVQSPQTM